MSDVGCRIRDFEFWILQFGIWNLDFAIYTCPIQAILFQYVKSRRSGGLSTQHGEQNFHLAINSCFLTEIILTGNLFFVFLLPSINFRSEHFDFVQIINDIESIQLTLHGTCHSEQRK